MYCTLFEKDARSHVQMVFFRIQYAWNDGIIDCSFALILDQRTNISN